MNHRSKPSRGLRLLFSLLFLFPLLSVAQTTGSVSGQVSNAATRSYLEGAIVEVAGTAVSTTTDREGRFQLSGVAPGPATLLVSFTGLDAKRIPVTVTAGGRVTQDIELTSDIYKMEKFTVAGEREGTARAETLQRLAPNVKTIVSSDTFGNVADGNIGNMLQQTVGITADYNGPDVRQISIRGVGSALNSVTMDGQQVATAQSAGTGRQFEFEQASLGNIETIEVTKAPTPDMDGASIGGSVNLVTKSAFDRTAGRVITYSLGFATGAKRGPAASRWKHPVKGFGPSINFMYSDVIGEKKNIGITWTGTINSQPGGGGLRGTKATGTSTNSFERKNDPGPVFNYSTNVNKDREVGYNGPVPVPFGVGFARSRIANGLKLDYRWSEQTTVSFNTSYNFFHENNTPGGHNLATIGVPTTAVPNVRATVDANGNRTGGGFIAPNYTSTFTRVFAGPNSISTFNQTGANDKSGRTYLFSPSVRHRFNGLTIDYSAGYSNSATYYDVSHRNQKFDSRPKGGVTFSLAGVGWTADRSRDSIWPTITQTEGPDWTNLSNYRSLLISQTDLRGFDTVINGKFDLKKELPVSLPTYIKTGFTIQQQDRKLWNDPRRWNYTGPDGILNTADDNRDLIQFAEQPGSARMNAYGVSRHLEEHPELWKEDIAFASGKLTSLKSMKEKIAAAYIMGNVRLGKLSVLTGVRMEDTRDTGEGPLTYLSRQEVARRAAWVGPVTDPEQRRRDLEQFGRRDTNKGQYRFYLPGVHLKYEPLDGMVARLSWSTGVGRPAFGSIIPTTTINDTAQTVTETNPNLKPQYANNWDFSAEYYFKPQGMISVGAFSKKIKDYIATDRSQFIESGANNGYDGQYVGYNIVTSSNSGDATIEGLEASYQQQLTFLPGWAKGFGAYANVTKLRTHGTNSAFQAGPTSSAGGTLAGFLDVTGNVGLSYRGFGFDLRLQSNYRGEYLTSNSTTPALVQWQKPKWTTAWKSRYNYTQSLGVFFDIENIFETPLDNIYAAYPDRIVSYRTFSLRIKAGITGRF